MQYPQCVAKKYDKTCKEVAKYDSQDKTMTQIWNQQPMTLKPLTVIYSIM